MEYTYGYEAAESLQRGERGLEVQIAPDLWVDSEKIVMVRDSLVPNTVGFDVGHHYVYVPKGVFLDVRRPKIVTPESALLDAGFDATWALSVLADAGFEIRKATD